MAKNFQDFENVVCADINDSTIKVLPNNNYLILREVTKGGKFRKVTSCHGHRGWYRCFSALWSVNENYAAEMMNIEIMQMLYAATFYWSIESTR